MSGVPDQPVPAPWGVPSAPDREEATAISREDLRRALYALSALAICEIIGTVGFQAMTGMGWVNAFYEESMLATGQGPAIALPSQSVSEVFASIMGFMSLGSTLTALVFTVGPIIARMWHRTRIRMEAEARKLEDEAKHIEEEIAHGVKEIEAELHRRKAPPGPGPGSPPSSGG